MSLGELVEEGKKTNAILTLLTDVIDADFLNACAHLDIISQFAVGYDNINIPEATKLGIAVGYTPGSDERCNCRHCFWVDDSSLQENVLHA